MTNLRSQLLSGTALLLSMVSAMADDSATNLPPGPVAPPSATNAQPATPAPPQANTKSAPGGQSPNGANGINLAGKPMTKSPNSPSKKTKKANVASAPTPATAPAPAAAKTAPEKPATSVLTSYLQELNDTLKLSADEKNDIQTYYLQDGNQLRDILNNLSLSPLDQAAQVADLRGKRDDKIEALLSDVERRGEFHRVEARYRVALTEAAAAGALSPAQIPAPVPAPTSVTPGQAEPTPTQNHPVE